MTDLGAETPSPNLVAAHLVLGSLASERVLWWAAQWLADGRDGLALRELAGLDGRDTGVVWDLLPSALADMAVEIPDSAAAAATVTFDYLARMCLSGNASERWVSQKVEETVALTGYDEAVVDLPLGKLYGFEDEWEGGWGLPKAELCEQVRAACAVQLNTQP